jgi:3-hydroxybutyryl-CoA dehydratase
MEKLIRLGDIFEYSFQFSQSDVIKFAEASGDFNPLHLDNDFATQTIFGKTIIHGFLGGSVFSKVFGTIFPGQGTIYLKQDMSFLKPMFTELKYTARFEVLETIKMKSRAVVKTTIHDIDNQLIIIGEAIIQHVNII